MCTILGAGLGFVSHANKELGFSRFNYWRLRKREKMMEKETEMERYLDWRIHTPWLRFTGEERELKSFEILFINNCGPK